MSVKEHDLSQSKPYSVPISSGATPTLRSLQKKMTALSGAIHGYNPRFDPKLLSEAVKWTLTAHASPKISTVRDHFKDCLLIAEEMVRAGDKPDQETVIASILYTAARFPRGRKPNDELLKDIEAKFGKRIRYLVEDTLRFRAMKFSHPPLDGVQDKAERDHFLEAFARPFRLMALWAVRDPRAILIYTRQYCINLQQEIDVPGTFRSAKLKAMRQVADLILAPLCYIAGFSTPRRKIMNLSYQLADPVGFERTSRIIAEAVRNPQMEIIRARLIDHLEKDLGWSHGHHFRVELRAKAAASAAIKAARKGQKVSELGDLCGARIILLPPALDLPADFDAASCDEHERDRLLEKLGNADLHGYGHLSKAFGRGNLRPESLRQKLDQNGAPLRQFDGPFIYENYSFIKERLRELAEKEPREKDKDRQENPVRFAWECQRYPSIRDARFDDYISRPKPSGYSGVQDTLWILLDPYLPPVEIEVQVVDFMRHDNNTHGPRAGHVLFKSGLFEHADAVQAWQNRARNHVAGLPSTGNDHVLVLGADDHVINISSNPTLGGFLAATGQTTALCAEISHNYDYRIAAKVVCDYATPLENGCRIKPLSAFPELKPA